jgi:hypothetical protein
VGALKKISMFWEGRLSRLERLSIASYVQNGHDVEVFGYSRIDGLPEGATWLDANEVVEKSELFLTKKGSYAPFSDYFRAKLLLDRGGIWSDTDMICLRPLDYDSDVIVGYETSTSLNSALLGLPKSHPIAARIVEAVEDPARVFPIDDLRTRRRKWLRRFAPGDRRAKMKWGETGPSALTRWVEHYDMLDVVLPYWHFYPVPPTHWKAIFDLSFAENMEMFGQSRAIHLWNEFIRRGGIDKNGPFERDSLIGKLLRRYGI